MSYYKLLVLVGTMSIVLSAIGRDYATTTIHDLSNHLMLIDSQVEEVSKLFNYRLPEDFEVRIANAQLEETTEARNIHLISHARPGALFINNQWKNSVEIAAFLKRKGLFSSSEQNLLIYGCEFAKGEIGETALAELKMLLGDVKIAASNDITGKDGDWELEVGDPLTSIQLLDYPHNLQTGDGTPSWKAAKEGDEDATVHLGLFNGNDVESSIHTYDAPSDARLYIAVKEGDQVYLGMNCKGNQNDFDFQVRGPVSGGITADPLNSTGTEPVVFGPTLAFGDGNGLTDMGNGYVADEATVCNGVNQVTGGTTGYDGLPIINSASAGYYYIEFENIANSDLTTCIFDVTVVSSAGVVQTGRLFSYRWSLYNRGTGNPGFSITDLDFYSYHTQDSTVSFFQMDNVVPGGFQVAVTDHGLADNGNLAVDRKSVPYTTTPNDAVPGDFPIFFTEPDECFFPLLTSEPTAEASPIYCSNTTSTIDITLDRAGAVLVYLDFNDNQNYEASSDIIIADQAFSEGTTALAWDGNDANGNPVADGAKVPIVIVYKLGETHIPLGDFEANPNGFSGDLIKPTSQAGNLSFFWDHSCLSSTDDFASVQNLTDGCTNDMCSIWDPGTAYSGSDANQAWVNTWFANTLTFEDEIMVMYSCNTTNAENDINQTPVNTPVSGSVATNDTDAEGDNQTVTSALADTDGDGIVDEPLMIGVPTQIYGTDDNGNIVVAGEIVLESDGSYTYTPATDFTGDVPIEYTVTDDNPTMPETDTATLVIEVVSNDIESNNPPVANDDTNTTDQDVNVSGNVLINDDDPDEDPITVTSALVDTDGDGILDEDLPLGTPTVIYGTNDNGSIVVAGEITLNPDGSYDFDPDPNFTGDVPIDYTISDPDGLMDDATLVITINPDPDGTNNNTYANDDANIGPQGVQQVGNILTNDNDPEGDAQTVVSGMTSDGTPIVPGTVVTLPSGGTLTVDSNGDYVYDPAPDFVGTEIVTYTISDGMGGTDTATVYLTTLPCIILIIDTSTDNCATNSAEVEITIIGGEGVYTITGFPNEPITIGVAGMSGASEEVETGITSMGTYTFTATAADGCSNTTDVFVGGDCPLPVDLVYFDGKVKDCVVHLSWRTESERNNDHFELQHSSNGKEFTSIAKIKGAGTSFVPQGYTYQHQLPSDINYYRLKQVDADGSYEYHKTIVFNATCKLFEIGLEVYPNPVSSNETLYLKYDQQASVLRLIDIYGRTVKVFTVESNHSNTISIDVNDLTVGQYTIVDNFGNKKRFIVSE